MSKKLLVLIIAIFTAFSILACEGVSEDVREEPEEFIEEHPELVNVNVYVSGYYNDGEKDIACYWAKIGDENTQRVDLHTTSDSRATDIKVVNGNIYVSGYYTDGGDTVAVYWKNGTPIEIHRSIASELNSIEVSTLETVYVSGRYYNTDTFSLVAAYWRNGLLYDLTDSGEAYKVINSSGNVYVAGHINGKAVYWKNGFLNTLEDTDISVAHGIFLHNNDVYVSGYVNSSGEKQFATYWKNGTRTELSIHDSESEDIFVTDNGIYVAGDEEGTSAYWKDGTKTLVEQFSHTTGVYVHNEIVYLSGYYTNGFISHACIWVDSTKIEYPVGEESEASSIFVEDKN